MAQIKIFGVDEKLNPIKQKLSDVIHSCVVDALKYPQDIKGFTDSFHYVNMTFFILKEGQIITQSLRVVYLRVEVLK